MFLSMYDMNRQNKKCEHDGLRFINGEFYEAICRKCKHTLERTATFELVDGKRGKMNFGWLDRTELLTPIKID